MRLRIYLRLVAPTRLEAAPRLARATGTVRREIGSDDAQAGADLHLEVWLKLNGSNVPRKS
eukprot:3520197-Pleurochrysis_carterae.AAC.4